MLEDKLDALLKGTRFNLTLAAEVSSLFLASIGDPLNMAHRLVAMGVLHKRYHQGKDGWTP